MIMHGRTIYIYNLHLISTNCVKYLYKMGGDDIVVEEKVGLSFWKGNKRHTKEQNMRERERERERGEEKRR
jgi:hypothetical protein